MSPDQQPHGMEEDSGPAEAQLSGTLGNNGGGQGCNLVEGQGDCLEGGTERGEEEGGAGSALSLAMGSQGGLSRRLLTVEELMTKDLVRREEKRTNWAARLSDGASLSAEDPTFLEDSDTDDENYEEEWDKVIPVDPELIDFVLPGKTDVDLEVMLEELELQPLAFEAEMNEPLQARTWAQQFNLDLGVRFGHSGERGHLDYMEDRTKAIANLFGTPHVSPALDGEKESFHSSPTAPPPSSLPTPLSFSATAPPAEPGCDGHLRETHLNMPTPKPKPLARPLAKPLISSPVASPVARSLPR
ncbi:unnamed protein product, partial [Discosporangium mesarthrocarpum]